MATRASITTEEYLKTVPLPQYQGKYAVISHQHIIDTTMQLLTEQNLFVEKALYKTGKGGDIAIGKYHIKSDGDNEMQMMFAWGNSYNKQMTFKCAIGAQLFVCENGIIAGDHSSYGRKHMGNALEECTEQMKYQITNANQYYTQLIEDKKNMKEVMVSEKLRAELLGRLLFEKDALTLEQMGVVKAELKKATHDYNADKDSLWTMYNHITFALKKAHPRFWIDQQRQIHWFLCSEFGIGNYSTTKSAGNLPNTPLQSVSTITLDSIADIVNPNQIDLEVMIAEVEKEKGPELEKSFEDLVIKGESKIHVEESPFKEDGEVNMGSGSNDPSVDDVLKMDSDNEPEIDFNL